MSTTPDPAHRPSTPADGWVVLVPVKPPARGKSRLVGLDDDTRRALASAFALDTVAVCLATPGVAQVLVVTDDAGFASSLLALGAACIPDGDSGDLNATLRQAAAEAERRWPTLRPVALCADLPTLRPDDLADGLVALGVATGEAGAFVPDAAGVGTTAYAAAYDRFEPRYGGASRRAHLDAGCSEVAHAPATLRRDVDDLVDLQAATALGLGPRTATVVAGLGML